MDINPLIQRLKDASCPIHGKISEFKEIDGKITIQSCCKEFEETCQTICKDFSIEEAQKSILNRFGNR